MTGTKEKNTLEQSMKTISRIDFHFVYIKQVELGDEIETVGFDFEQVVRKLVFFLSDQQQQVCSRDPKVSTKKTAVNMFFHEDIFDVESALCCSEASHTVSEIKKGI